MKNKLTIYIGIALILGIIVGFLLNTNYLNSENNQIASTKAAIEKLNKQIKAKETATDSLAASKILTSIANINKEIKVSEKLIGTEKTADGLAQLRWQKDSIKVLTQLLATYADSTGTTYKNLKEEKAVLTAKESALNKALDKKLEWFKLLADVFLRLIKMIVAPLVFTTLVVGVAKLGDSKSVGRIGGKTMLWFVSASLVSLALGMILVNIFNPGAHMNIPLPDVGTTTGIDKNALNTRDFIYNIFPTSFFDAMAKNSILQIVVFSLFFGIACGAMGHAAKGLVDAIDTAAHVILKVTGYVMQLAPIAVFGAMTAVIAKQGLGILKTYSIFIGEFYFSLGILWLVIIGAGSIFLGSRVISLVKRIKDPILLAFSTSSSEAAFPRTMEVLEKFGCSNKITSFVLPLGYSFNLDGSMMYMTFASLFIAQSYGIHLDFPTQISMLLVLMLTSKGIAAVPRASLVVIAGALATFNIPEAGLALLLGIDPILDMGRTATNVVGNSVATAVVSKWEGELQDEQPA
jgi:Na+/H+-dicarboxylate symporter